MVLSKNFKYRLLAGVITILVVLSTIYVSHFNWGKPLFLLLTAGFISIALWEFYHIAKAKGYYPLSKIGIVSTLFYLLAIFYLTQDPAAAGWPETVLGLTVISSFLYYFVKGTDPFVNLALTLFGIFYLTLPLSCFVLINYFFPDTSHQDGRWWLFYLIVVTKITDTGAYFCGKGFGSSKLAPYISPKKTWEGALGGTAAGLLASVGLYYVTHSLYSHSPIGITLLQSIFLGISVSFVAQLGDLAESLLKRDVGVKDSNHLPGLGGMLDVLDSLVFTAPLVYIFMKMTQEIL